MLFDPAESSDEGVGQSDLERVGVGDAFVGHGHGMVGVQYVHVELARKMHGLVGRTRRKVCGIGTRWKGRQ